MNYYIGNFVAEDGTKFWQGPWFLDGDKYDYKLEESDGAIDYCDQDQMFEWGVKPKREIRK